MRHPILFLSALLLAACSADLPHDAPFDPDAPLNKQAKAGVTGRVTLEGETDFSQVAVQLVNAERTYSVETHADGGVELTGVVPGNYRLSIDARYYTGATEAVSVQMGETLDLGTRALLLRRVSVSGSALVERLVGGAPKTSGGVILSLAKSGSIRQAAPAYRTAATTPSQSVPLTAVSAANGGYQFAGVPAGVYDVVAAADDIGETPVATVTVTGEQDVVVDDVVLRPLTGFFVIEGLATGQISTVYTQTRAVNLKITASNAERMKIAQSADGTVQGCALPATGIVYNATHPLTLTGAEGKKLVCVRLVDENGNETETLVGTITLDESAPAPVNFAAVAPNGYVNGDALLVTVLAADNVSGVQSVRYSAVAADVTAAAAVPFQPTLSIPLTAIGPVTYWMQVVDAAGNASPPQSVTVTRDITSPGLAVTVKSGGTALALNERIGDPDLILEIAASDASPLEMQISNNGTPGAWEPYSVLRTVTLPASSSANGDPRDVALRLRDAAGNEATAFNFSVVLDSTGPSTPQLTITGKGAGNTVTGATVSVSLGASGAAAVELAFDPGFLTSLGAWSALASTTVTLPAGDGLKTLYARYFDDVGNVSAVVGDSVTLDMTPPQVISFTIAATSPTKTNPVTVLYSAMGAAELRLTEGAACGGAREAVGAGTKSVALSASEGLKSVALQFFDTAGNASECAVRTVYYDPNPPVVGAFAFPLPATSSNVVTVLFSGISGATKVMLSEDAGFAGADWSAYAPAKTFVLSAGNGVKTVYAKVADDAGHVVSLTQQTITLDTTPPTAPSIFTAVDVTTQTTVQLFLSAGLVTEMWLSQDDAAFTTGGWEPYSSAKSFALSGTDGTKTIYAKFRKSTGIETSVVSDTVVLDRTAPVLPSVRINNGAVVVTTQIVTLSLSAVDAASGLATYKVNTTNAFGAVSPKPFQLTDVFSLTSGDGLKTVWVTMGDRAGLYSAPVSATVLLDTAAPVAGSVSITKLDGTPLSSSDLVGENRVRLASTVTDLSGLEMQVTTNGSYAGVAWVPYDPNKVIDIAGAVTIGARVRDGAGLITDLISGFSLTVDTTPPTLTFNRTSASPTNSLAVSLSLSSEAGSKAQVSEDPGFTTAAWFNTASTTYTVAAGDGLHTIYARVRDAAGNLGDVKTVQVTVDQTPPQGADFTITSAAVTKSRTVSLSFSAIGASDVRAQEGASCGGTYGSYGPIGSVNLTSIGDGTKYVSVQYQDALGNESACITKSVVLDESAPLISQVQINSGAARTVERLATLTLSFSGAVTMQVSESAVYSGAAWQPVTTAVALTLSAGDGAKTVYVRLADAAGNTAASSASILLDTTPPVPGTLMLNGGAPVTSVAVVAWTVSANESASLPMQMQLSADPGFAGATWVAYATAGTFTLPAGDGTRSIYVRFRDAAGNVSPLAGASLTLDQSGPQITSLLVNGGSTYAATSVEIQYQFGNWSAGDNLQVATSAGFAGASLYAANAGANQVSYSLTGLDGPKTLYIRGIDSLGNAGPVYAAAITKDTAPPAVAGTALTLDAAAQYATSQFVTATLGMSGATEMMLSNDSGFAGAQWEPFASSTVWVLPAGDGVKWVYAKFRDAAGNLAGPYADAITLDTGVPAALSVRINDGAVYAINTTVTLSLVSVGATRMELSTDGIFDTEPAQAYAATVTPFTLPAGLGTKYVYARFSDDAGNVSSIVYDDIVLDTDGPTGSSFSIDEAPLTPLLNIHLTLASSGASEMQVSEGGCVGLWTAYATNASYNFQSSVDGVKTIYVRYRDVAGNMSACLSQTITLDTTAPNITSLSPRSGAAGREIVVNGINFGGGGSVTIGGASCSVSLWTNSEVRVVVPNSAPPGPQTLVMTSGGKNAYASMNVLPGIVATSPNRGPIGQTITLTGTGFGIVQGQVTVGGVAAPIAAWSNTSITLQVPPAAAGASPVVVSNGGVSSVPAYIHVRPDIASVTPASGPVGTTITLTGNDFGAPGAGSVTVGGVTVGVVSWSDTTIQVNVPAGLLPGKADVMVTVNSVASNVAAFTVSGAVIDTRAPYYTSALQPIVVGGRNFGAATGTVTVGGVSAGIVSWSPTQVAFNAPAGLAFGDQPIVVTPGAGGASNPVLVRYRVANSWDAQSDRLTERRQATAVWTGSEMIVWGGRNAAGTTIFNTGARYNPTTDTWLYLPLVGAPNARYEHTAVWTGREMIVWGGLSSGVPVNSGGRFNPALNTWTATQTAGAPVAVSRHAAVWTGSKMIVWGGTDGVSNKNTGGRYDPVLDSWAPTSVGVGAPSARVGHAVVWTGKEMLVWGGHDAVPSSPLPDGARYNPVTDAWVTMAASGIQARTGSLVVWSGADMIVWGGTDNMSYPRTDGGRYSPENDAWTPISDTLPDTPQSRTGATAVWTGNAMAVWGGVIAGAPTKTGGLYDPATNTWTAMTTASAPSGRADHAAVWAGTQMLVYGGWDPSFSFGREDGGRYQPGTNTWAPFYNNGPTPIAQRTYVNTGTEVLMWGGWNGGANYYNSGDRYDPATDRVRPMNTSGAPSARRWASGAWTGSKAVFWGGDNAGTRLNTGGRYDPATDSWQPTTTASAPSVRASATALWLSSTSQVMILNGVDGSGNPIFSAGRYNPITDAWIATAGISPKIASSYVWTGSEVVVFGGTDPLSGLVQSSTGSRYNPSTNTWSSVADSLQPRAYHTAVWTGTQMLVFGGEWYDGVNTVLDTISHGQIWTPGGSGTWADMYVGMNEPAARSRHFAEWTGKYMVIWGGEYHYSDPGWTFDDVVLDGSRYDPAADDWFPMAAAPATALQSMQWIGNEILFLQTNLSQTLHYLP